MFDESLVKDGGRNSVVRNCSSDNDSQICEWQRIYPPTIYQEILSPSFTKLSFKSIYNVYLLVRNDMDVNEQEKLPESTLRQILK